MGDQLLILSCLDSSGKRYEKVGNDISFLFQKRLLQRHHLRINHSFEQNLLQMDEQVLPRLTKNTENLLQIDEQVLPQLTKNTEKMSDEMLQAAHHQTPTKHQEMKRPNWMGLIELHKE